MSRSTRSRRTTLRVDALEDRSVPAMLLGLIGQVDATHASAPTENLAFLGRAATLLFRRRRTSP